MPRMTAVASLSLPDRFTCHMEGLMKDVEAQVVWGWTPILLIKLLWRRLRHIKARFASVMARFRAGTLPAPGSARRRSARPRAAAEPPPLVLPRRVGWVLQTISGTLIPGYELEKMVEDPELAALVAAAPPPTRAAAATPDHHSPRRRRAMARSVGALADA
jgi:hypothetical protein